LFVFMPNPDVNS